MKKRIKKNIRIIVAFIVGMLCSGVTVYAAYQYMASQVIFKPSNTEWKVNTVEEALNDLYSKSTSEVYHNMTINYDKDIQDIVYKYEGKEIKPIYWYGYLPKVIFSGELSFTQWYENNIRATATKYDDHMKITYNVTNPRSQCVGGYVTNYKINLSNYSKLHVVVGNTSTALTAKIQRSNVIGSMGSSTSNETNFDLNIPAGMTEVKEYVVDISSMTSSHYVGLASFCQSGSLDLYAMWLE